MKYFVQCTRNGHSCYMSWEGQTQDQVNALLIELEATDIQFITEEEFNTYVQSHQPVIGQ